jgi:hypothetical protein
VRGGTIAGGGVAAGDVDPNYMGESPNVVTDHYGTVGGGYANQSGDGAASTLDSPFATIAWGQGNTARGPHAAIGGGLSNDASGISSTIGGGSANNAAGLNSTIGGGDLNVASGDLATVPGGANNLAEGNYSFAAGRRAKARGQGSFAFADSSPFDFSSFFINAFRVRATGGVVFVTDIDGTGTTTWSCVTTAGNSWSCSSDRNLKQDLVPLDGGAVLARLAQVPLYAWSPKGRNAHVRHYGPMAQDFHAAFGLGDDETMIGMQDADGVALAAIQGLNAKVESQAREIAELRRAIESLLATGIRPAR